MGYGWGCGGTGWLVGRGGTTRGKPGGIGAVGAAGVIVGTDCGGGITSSAIGRSFNRAAQSRRFKSHCVSRAGEQSTATPTPSSLPLAVAKGLGNTSRPLRSSGSFAHHYRVEDITADQVQRAVAADVGRDHDVAVRGPAQGAGARQRGAEAGVTDDIVAAAQHAAAGRRARAWNSPGRYRCTGRRPGRDRLRECSPGAGPNWGSPPHQRGS